MLALACGDLTSFPSSTAISGLHWSHCASKDFGVLGRIGVVSSGCDRVMAWVIGLEKEDEYEFLAHSMPVCLKIKS